MSTINLCRCDSCGSTAPIPPDGEESPPGWIFLVTSCGGSFDACSTACSIANHPADSETKKLVMKPVSKPPKAEKPS